MEDRIVQYPNRIKLVPVDGQPDTYDIEEVPGEVTSEGTPLSKATLLTDVTGERYGLTPTGTIAEVLDRNVQQFLAAIPLSGWSAEPDAEGWYTNRVTVTGMREVYNPIMDLVITDSGTASAERDSYSQIVECDTYDDYVIFKCVIKPSSDLNVRFIGV